MTIAIVLDNYKPPTFRKNLKEAGYGLTNTLTELMRTWRTH